MDLSCVNGISLVLAISAACPKVREDPWLINFFLTLGELVPNTILLQIISSVSLKPQPCQ